MSESGPPPIMRGDLFSLLDPEGAEPAEGVSAPTIPEPRSKGKKAKAPAIPDAGEAQVTPGGIGAAARRLIQRVAAGERAPGVAVVMQCLTELAQLSDDGDPMRAFWALASIKQRLLALGLAKSRAFPGVLVAERHLILPQARGAQVVRAMPAGGARDIWFVATREVNPFLGAPPGIEAIPDGRPELADSALGPPLVPTVEVTFRMFRFGADPSDIRMVMRIQQEPGAFCDVLGAFDGERVALLSRDVLGVFDPDGKPILSGRIPFQSTEEGIGAEVTAIALQADILALNLRQDRERPVELALIAIPERKGFPVGGVGDDASVLVLGPKQAYIVDGLTLVRMPLFAEKDEPVRVLAIRPWFAEYPWSARLFMAWDGTRVWLSNGQKMLVIDDDLAHVRAEIVLPEPIVDFSVAGTEVRLVHLDRDLGRLRIAVYEVD